MSIYNDIQTIAKTKELTEKVDKAITVAQDAKKEAIGVKRATAIQTGSGLPFVESGNNGSGGAIAGVDADGNPIEGPLAPPPVPSTKDPSQSSSGDSKTSSDSNSGVNVNDALKDNDKSGSAVTNDLGRLPSKDQADPTNSSVAADIEKITDAMVANGASPEEIARAVQLYLQKRSEKGVNEISDIYNGNAGYTPTAGNWTSIAPNTGEYGPVTALIEELRAIVGMAGEKAVRINLDGVEPVPSAEESADAGQGIWADANSPPVLPGWEDWEQGYYYEVSSAYTEENDFGATRFLALDACGQSSVGYHDATFNYDVTDYEILSAEVGASPNMRLYIVWNDTPAFTGWSNYTATVFKRDCGGPGTEGYCPTVAPRESYLPPIGMWMMTQGSGGFYSNPYDSEVPLAYQGTSLSKIILTSAITGDDYSISVGANGGTIIANETNPKYFLYFGADRTLKTVAPMDYLPFYKAKPE